MEAVFTVPGMTRVSTEGPGFPTTPAELQTMLDVVISSMMTPGRYPTGRYVVRDMRYPDAYTVSGGSEGRRYRYYSLGISEAREASERRIREIGERRARLGLLR